MTKRCKHEIWTKDDYPDDLICQKCETIWHISECMEMTAKQLMMLPKEVRFIVLTKQAEKFNQDNPNYHTKPEELSSVREELKQIYCDWCPLDCEEQGTLTDEERMGCVACIGAIDDMLSLKHPNGEPMIGIIAEDQSVPENPYKNATSKKDKYTKYNAAAIARQGILKANFRRIEVEK